METYCSLDERSPRMAINEFVKFAVQIGTCSSRAEEPGRCQRKLT